MHETVYREATMSVYKEVSDQLVGMYGPAAIYALETSCVTTADCELGLDHVLGMILPALEEELIADVNLEDYNG